MEQHQPESQAWRADLRNSPLLNGDILGDPPILAVHVRQMKRVVAYSIAAQSHPAEPMTARAAGSPTIAPEGVGARFQVLKMLADKIYEDIYGEETSDGS